MAALFPGFDERRIRTTGCEINAVVGAAGPPLLLLHGLSANARDVAQDRAGTGRAFRRRVSGSTRVWRFRQAARRTRSSRLFETGDGSGAGRGHARARIRALRGGG